jgi:predicted aspartyl protease
MPSITFHLAGQAQKPDGKPVLLPPPIALQQRGPVIQVSVMVEENIAKTLAQQGQQVPQPKTGWALIDTGASVTCIDEQAAKDLNLPAIDVVPMASASHHQTQQNVYPVQILIPGLRFNLQAPRAVGAALQAQGLLVLIGRDVLQMCTLFYNGPSGQITLSI